jgi:hypothetical protein
VNINLALPDVIAKLNTHANYVNTIGFNRFETDSWEVPQNTVLVAAGWFLYQRDKRILSQDFPFALK